MSCSRLSAFCAVSHSHCLNYIIQSLSLSVNCGAGDYRNDAGYVKGPGVSSTGAGVGGHSHSTTGTGQGGQGGQGYGVAGMIPGTEANREKKADQGQYGERTMSLLGYTCSAVTPIPRHTAYLQLWHRVSRRAQAALQMVHAVLCCSDLQAEQCPQQCCSHSLWECTQAPAAPALVATTAPAALALEARTTAQAALALEATTAPAALALAREAREDRATVWPA